MKLNEYIEITNEDNMELMARYPDKYFALCIIDPPYGIGEDGSKSHSRSKMAKSKNYKAFAGNDLKSPDKDFFNELFRISKNQIIFGANHFISKIPFDSSCWIVWDKDNTGNFADCELAWASFDTAVRKFKWRWNGMLQQNMKDKQERIHPTEKPIQLYEWILFNYAKPNQKILDTHLGSGSIAIAIEKANRINNMGLQFTGIELDEEYYNAALQRFKIFAMQQTIMW